MAGIPMLPKMSAQFTNAFMTLAATSATMMGRTRFIACRYLLKTTYASNGGADHTRCVM